MVKTFTNSYNTLSKANELTSHMPREYCETCQRPKPVCYCDSIVETHTDYKVTIIQHPQESNHPFNTGCIAHRCLSNSELIIAEKVDDKLLHDFSLKNSVLLYPDLDWLPNNNFITRELSLKTQVTHNIDQLIVLDATWRKSKKILHLNQELQFLPRINLTITEPSEYKVRKSSFENSLSTIESIAMALNILTPNESYRSLLKPFKRMIELQSKIAEHHRGRS